MAHPILEDGDCGPHVVELQRALRAAGHVVRVTGQFDEATGQAVRNVQRLASLDPSGVVTDETWAALNEARARGPA